ncbi:hypothetical protein BDV95DRAFT_113433 [Massariosphaeria phaeospora]|uniref:RING-type E3 ubiquitin transferase n=1 Tax=Massariosphaeria phaeospora TaxID=100035 RepID=A0A7C8IBP8_9PLEO|nr:hypothetical protein BDV95DRAFT_113433 [Massariosphaeria phaeospora]
MTRLQIYVASSAVLANLVLLRAYYGRPNFYSAAVHISQSTGSLLFLINLSLIVTASIGYGLQRLFYGPLRPIETEQLYDKAWFALSETALAMTIFRDDIGMWFFVMFLALLAGKVWHWIGEGRVEFLEQQPPANPRLFHARLTSSLLLSIAFDIFMLQYCLDSILQDSRPGVMVMFGFEYVLLAVASCSTFLRYTLTLVELLVIRRQEQERTGARILAREQREHARQQEGAAATADLAAEDDDDEDEIEVPGWEEKGRWVFYLDLTTDFIKSVMYLGFFVILVIFYGFPIHIMRDLFMTVRSFIKRVNDFIQYRNATRDMNARYPDATAEELERENTCIVCREEMRPWVEPGAGNAQAGRRVDERQRAKKLPCGHILHFSCLRSWLERQQVCPTCRRPVLSQAPQINRQNNQANNGQQNQQNPGNPGAFGQMFQGNLGHGQQGQPGQQGQQRGQQNQQNQQNRPAGNMRVYNFGPIRIALGNLRLPDPQGNPNANNINNNNNMIANLAQQLAQNQNQNQDQNQQQDQTQNAPATQQLPASFTLPTGPFAGAHPHNPADIQSDILRIQHNIIESLRHLNAQHDQLQYIHALLGELNRLQQASGLTGATGQELPAITPLNPQQGAPMVPQAYFARGPVLRQGDAGLPNGLVLPDGWTLRPMALAPRTRNEDGQVATRSEQIQSVAGAASARPTPSSSNSTTQPRAESSSAYPLSSAAPDTSSAAAGSSSKVAEPSSLESSWSFGNAPGSNEASGSSSAVVGSSTEAQNVTRRSATVEEAEDDQ